MNGDVQNEGYKGTWDALEYVEWKYENAEIPNDILVDLFGGIKSVKEMGRSLESLPDRSKQFIVQTLQLVRRDCGSLVNGY